MMRKHLKRGHLVTARSQSGAALILIMFILGLAIAAYTIKAFTVASMQATQDQETMKALAEAKAALIAWAVSNPDAPGQMPFPDRKETSNPNYDGRSDCYLAPAGFSYKFLIGQLPIYGQDNPCVSPKLGLGGDWHDAQGNRFWYAVSRNLVHDYEVPVIDPDSNPVINPGLMNEPYADAPSYEDAPYQRLGGTKAYPWLRVFDRSGRMLSDRVAAVIIAPGLPLPGQDRSGVADVTEYLDSLQIGVQPYSNANYDSPGEDFIIGDDSSKLSDADTTYQRPYYFNDKLVYITIDELMMALEKRVANEVKVQLKKYYEAKAVYPYATPLGVSKGYTCKTGSLNGLLPLDPAVTCNYDYQKTDIGGGILDPITGLITGGGGGGVNQYATAAACSFEHVAKIIFRRSKGGNYTNAESACSYDNNRGCSCTGAGSCSASGEPTFSCTSDGVCTSAADKNNEDSVYTFEGGYFTADITGACTSSTPACSPGKGYPVSCTGGNSTTSDTFANNCSEALNTLPEWFRTNDWQDYVYYAIARDGSPTMKVGTKTDVAALLATTGSAIVDGPYVESKAAAQSRASCNLNDYLDSDKDDATNGIYDATNRLRTPNYNDQLFIVAP